MSEEQTPPSGNDMKPEPASDRAEQVSSPAGTPAGSEKTPARPGTTAHRSKWQNVGIDAFLVLLVIGVAGFTVWLLKEQKARYYVPTPYEVAREENARLRHLRDELQPQAYKAEEQILFQQKLASRERELEKLRRANTAREAGLKEKERQILAKQHEIRQTDKEHRQVAMSLLPAMRLGTVRTKKGSRVYYDAYITRVEGRTLVLAHNSGMVRIAVSDLVAESLPPLARYAFGVDDLLHIREMDAENAARAAEGGDGSEASAEPASPVATPRASSRMASSTATPGKTARRASASAYGYLSATAYDPPSAKPVVNVQLPAQPATPASNRMEDTSLIATPMNEAMPYWLKKAR